MEDYWMEIEKEKITDLISFVNVVDEVNKRFEGQVWWRGQSNISWNLLPSIYRINGGYEYERNIINRFKQRAPSRNQNTPGADDDFSWLFLMQHHGLPTRLLDWTESPLFACFFAVENMDNNDCDGAIFALCPYKLNFNQVNISGVLLPGDGIAKRAINQAFSRPDYVSYVIGILPYEMHIRIMVQLSAFTLHASDRPLDDMTDSEDYLLKFLIPKEAKVHLKEQLKFLGVRESNLFPDLDHLAEEIKALSFRDPPKPESTINSGITQINPSDDKDFYVPILSST
jgi:hypothetical protein